MSNTMPVQVNEFVNAIKANAGRVWTDESFIDSLVYVSEDIGVWTVLDNTGRFFPIRYLYFASADGTPGVWKVSNVYSGKRMRNYSFEQTLADARIMYTG